jgi:hypothetical protein
MKKIVVFLWLSWALLFSALVHAATPFTTRVLGEGAEYSTTMYIYDSGKPGKDMVVVGGIHLPLEESGTTVFEPGKPLDLQALTIDRGRLFVIPAFNEKRIPRRNIDMNRLWRGADAGQVGEGVNELAREYFAFLRDLKQQGNLGFVLDLHEGFANSLGNTILGGGEMGAKAVDYLNQLPEIHQSVASDSKRGVRPFKGAFFHLPSPIIGSWTRSSMDILQIPAAIIETTGQSNNSTSPDEDSLELRELFNEQAVKFIASQLGITISTSK